MPASENLILVAGALRPIESQRFVFAGASILPLLLNDPAAPAARVTVDVDAVVDVVTYSEWERLQSRMHDCGLRVRADVAVGKSRICLFHLDQLEVDIMPVRFPEVIRPSRMLELGFEFAEPHQLTEDLEILALSAPGLLAAKLEAFWDRGVREFPASKDLEDIVALLDRRLDIGTEVTNAPAEMRYYIAAGMRHLIGDGQVMDVIVDILRDRERERRIFDLMRLLSG